MLFILSGGKRTASPCRVVPGAEPPGSRARTSDPAGTVLFRPEGHTGALFVPAHSAHCVCWRVPSFLEKSLQSPWDGQALRLLLGFPGPLPIPATPEVCRGLAESRVPTVELVFDAVSLQHSMDTCPPWPPALPDPLAGPCTSVRDAGRCGLHPNLQTQFWLSLVGAWNPAAPGPSRLATRTFGGREVHVDAGAQFTRRGAEGAWSTGAGS